MTETPTPKEVLSSLHNSAETERVIPTCLKIGSKYYKNSFGLDRKVVNRCLNLAAQCKKLKIPVTTFMIASDPYLQKFVEEFTEMNHGKAFFASLDKLGSFIFNDFESGKRKTVY